MRFAPIVEIERKKRATASVEEWHAEAPLPPDEESMTARKFAPGKKNKVKKGKEQGVFENDIKATKAAKRLNNYASVYSMRIKETLSPDGHTCKAIAGKYRTLKSLEETKLSDIGGNEEDGSELTLHQSLPKKHGFWQQQQSQAA